MAMNLILCVCLFQQATERISYDAKLAAMPDFCQEDHRHGKLPFEGSVLCAPVAVSNALVWLDEHGFPKIIAGSRNTPRRQAALIRELASERYMFTLEDGGTSPLQLIRGVERLLKNRGYGAAIENMGWRSQTKSVGQIPDVQWMLNSVEDDSNLLLNVGWYVFEKERRVYRRTAGHFVTVAGYEQSGSDVTLHIHDPAKSDGLEKQTTACTLRPLKGKTRLEGGLTIAANGFFELDGIQVKEGNDVGIVDQAIAFKPTKD